MNRSERLSRSERSNRIFPALMAFWFAFCLAQLYQDGFRHFGGLTGIDAMVGLVSCVAWLVTTLPRLGKLKLNQLWMAVLALPFAVAVFALWKAWSAAFWVALLIGVIAQFSVYFLGPRSAEPSIQSDNPGETST